MATLHKRPNKYVEIYRLLDGNPNERVKAMLKKYARHWDIDEHVIKKLLQDPHSTAEDIIDTLKVFSSDFGSSPELRLALIAMHSGTQKIRREHLVTVDEHDDEPDDQPRHHHHHRPKAA